MAKPNGTTASLARLFPNQAVLDVLALLVLHPDQEFYQRELVDRTQNTVLQVQRALRRIEDAGLVVKSKRGNRAYYSAQRRHPAFEDLKRILLKTVGLGDQLRAALQPVAKSVRLAWIFGSVATGSEGSESDVDLIIVGQLTSRQAIKILAPIGRSLGREFNPVIYPEKEFRSKARRGNQFIRKIISEPKIWLVGGEDELTELAA